MIDLSIYGLSKTLDYGCFYSFDVGSRSGSGLLCLVGDFLGGLVCG